VLWVASRSDVLESILVVAANYGGARVRPRLAQAHLVAAQSAARVAPKPRDQIQSCVCRGSRTPRSPIWPVRWCLGRCWRGARERWGAFEILDIATRRVPPRRDLACDRLRFGAAGPGAGRRDQLQRWRQRSAVPREPPERSPLAAALPRQHQSSSERAARPSHRDDNALVDPCELLSPNARASSAKSS